MPQVKVGDINMYYEVHGEGMPLVLIHGLSADTNAWMFQTPELAKKYKVIIFDNRGIGQTDTPDMPYSAQMMADDTARLMDALDIAEAHFLGYSLGGFIAQELAIKYPQKVRSLILAASAACMPLRTKLIEETWGLLIEEGVGPGTLMKAQLPYFFTETMLESPGFIEMTIDSVLQNPQPQPNHGFIRQLSVCLEHDARNRLSMIKAPSLILVGSEDCLLPVKTSQELAEGIPKAKLEVLDGGGHAFTIETPDKLNQAILDFLADVDSK